MANLGRRVDPTALEVLQGARQLIAEGWCQGEPARDAAGKLVPPNTPDACAFCLWGALEKMYYTLSFLRLGEGYDSVAKERRARAAYNEAVRIVEDQVYPGGAPIVQDEREGSAYYKDLSDWNDEEGRTQEEVLAVLDETITRIEKGDDDA